VLPVVVVVHRPVVNQVAVGLQHLDHVLGKVLQVVDVKVGDAQYDPPNDCCLNAAACFTCTPTPTPPTTAVSPSTPGL
jgi:hypothetical protein